MILEICAASVEDCITAERGGADRIELNCALAVGGLTPSAGLIREAVAAVSIPVIVMIRPRDGGFCYSPAEFKTMQRDIDLALGVGAAGAAFGILLENGQIDAERNRTLVEQIKDADAVFHRAFDLAPDPLRAMETCIDTGFKRILTSGQAVSAPEGTAVLRTLIAESGQRIEILPAAGITGSTAGPLIEATGCSQIHCSLTMLSRDLSGLGSNDIDFRSHTVLPPEAFTSTDFSKVKEMFELLTAYTDRG